MTKKAVVLTFISLLLLAGLPLIFINGLDQLGCEGNLVNHYNLPMPAVLEIKGDFTLGQTFTAPRNGLQEIDVALRTYDRHNTHNVTFYLKQSPDSPQVIYQETFNAGEARDYPWRAFKFTPIPDSVGKTYYFYFTSPDSVTGNAISTGGAQGDFYNGGTAYFGPLPTEADLAFCTYYGLSITEKLSILGQRIVENKPSIWSNLHFYGLLLALYVLILLRVFVEIIRLIQMKR